MSKIIAVVNQKGGVGKTTTSINLSAAIAKNNKKVLLIDVDPQGNATSGVGVDKSEIKNSSYEVIIGESTISEASLDTKTKNLRVCPSNIQLAGAEVELVSMISRETRLKIAIDEIKDKYDYIFIDCPPSLGLITINALTSADSILVPIQCEYYALEGLSQLVNTIKLIQKHLNKNLQLEGVVMTMHDSRNNLSNQVVNEVIKHFDNKVFKTLIPRNVRLSEAPSYGLPINMYDPKSKGSKAYNELAKELIKNSNGGSNK